MATRAKDQSAVGCATRTSGVEPAGGNMKPKRVYKAPPRFEDKCCLCGRPPVRQTDDGSRLCAVHSARLDDIERDAQNRRAGLVQRTA